MLEKQLGMSVLQVCSHCRVGEVDQLTIESHLRWREHMLLSPASGDSRGRQILQRLLPKGFYEGAPSGEVRAEVGQYLAHRRLGVLSAIDSAKALPRIVEAVVPGAEL